MQKDFICFIFIHAVSVCLPTGPLPLPKRVLHRVRSSSSYLNFRYPLFFVSSSGSCLRLLPRPPVTSTVPSTFPSVMCFREENDSEIEVYVSGPSRKTYEIDP